MHRASDATPPLASNSEPIREAPAARELPRVDGRRWWLALVLQPLLFLVCGVVLIVGLGLAQRTGLISSAGGDVGHQPFVADGTRFICPMMCTPPRAEPGRCPVCAMELVPATAAGEQADPSAIHVPPAARRVANIQTVTVATISPTRTIRSVGELDYDEGSLKTISAYVDGRLERLYADYTGAVVEQGDHLALLYSPRLYSAQVELLLAGKSRGEGSRAGLTRVTPGRDLYASARQRLVELGMTTAQIEQLEQAGEANSRLRLCAPISGTVIEKLAVEGQYIQEGDAIYRLADLSTLWLMLRLFPEEAAAIRYGQRVEAEVQSLPGRTFAGRVAFVDPRVDPRTRTVGVRVLLPNGDGALRVGDFAKATIDLPLATAPQSPIYDPELAGKWISPRHPHIVADSAGLCPKCGVELVPAAAFGFINELAPGDEALVIPRDAVLAAGTNSVVYVETEAGRFELRRVVLGPVCGDQVVVRRGLEVGEQVATRGNFLIDSQMQLAGNPSLIDPARLAPTTDEPAASAAIASLAELPPDDRALAERQRRCPVTNLPLGSMGPPPKVDVAGRSVFICCEVCRQQLLAEPAKFLASLTEVENGGPGASSSAAGAPRVPEPEPAAGDSP